jgi:ATP-binding cassette, subfamily B, bacterial PglK
MSLIEKVNFLLSDSQKRQLIVIGMLLIIGMFFEMAGLGVLIPALGIMLNNNIVNDYPWIRPYLETFGNPSQIELVISGMMLLVFIYTIKGLFLAFLSWKQNKFSADMAADLSRNLFKGYLKQPYSFHLERNSAHLLRNVQTEINLFNMVAQSVIALTTEFSLIISIATMLIFIEPLGATVVMVFLIFTAIIFHRITKNYLLNWGLKRQTNDGLMNQHLLQGLGGVKDVKLLGREENFVSQYSIHNIARFKILAKQNTLGQLPRLYLELLAVIGLAGLVILMVMQNKSLELLLPTLGIFIASAFRMIPSFNRIMGAMQQIRYAKPVVNLLYDEFKMIRSNKLNSQVSKKINFKKDIAINSVYFKYDNASSNALDGINITIKKGESVGFIGPSGSGKSSLVDIILGLLYPDKGRILVDGKNIKENFRGWQDEIGYVPQTIYLTDDTLRRNIAFGVGDSEIDDQAVMRSLRAAQLDDFIGDLKEGLDTFVGERGVRLSGGQRQRIGIARALYHDPPILVLDEATSALDSNTEAGVMDAVNALHGNKTLIIVAHRLSTVEGCDRLYRLDHGKVVDEGVPETILRDI